MKVIHHPGEAGYEQNTVATVGTFDGVHRAHQQIIRQVVQRARDLRGRSLVITFEPHPREIVRPNDGEVRILTTLDERIRELDAMGVDVLLVLAFDKEFSRQSPRDFYVKYLVEGTGVRAVYEGFDHHWGRDREGNIEGLKALGNEFGFEVVAITPVSLDGRIVNSSTIRSDLTEGNVEGAAKLLGRPYALRGKVIVGDRRGRRLGYPTANLDPDSPKKLLPRDGIYVARVLCGEATLGGMVSIGVRPTFHTNGNRTVEVNILDFDRDIYGEWLQVMFLRRLRDELQFGSAEDLVAQMRRDEAESRTMLQDMERSGMLMNGMR